MNESDRLENSSGDSPITTVPLHQFFSSTSAVTISHKTLSSNILACVLKTFLLARLVVFSGVSRFTDGSSTFSSGESSGIESSGMPLSVELGRPTGARGESSGMPLSVSVPDSFFVDKSLLSFSHFLIRGVPECCASQPVKWRSTNRSH